MNILVIDIGGTHVEVRAKSHKKRAEISSGSKITAGKMVAAVQQLTAAWKYETVTIGYPGLMFREPIVSESHNLGQVWAGFDFGKAFGYPGKS